MNDVRNGMIVTGSVAEYVSGNVTGNMTGNI